MHGMLQAAGDAVVLLFSDLQDPRSCTGMRTEIGYPYVKVFYKQKTRKRGITKNNFYTLYDVAMLGGSEENACVTNSVTLVN
jgi:hypothetical protein